MEKSEGGLNFLVVGGSSGIGAAVVRHLDAAGHKVWATSRTGDPPPDAPGNIVWHALDICDGETIDPGFLPEKLDGLAYCPGAIALKPFHRTAPADFMADYQLQFLGLVKVLLAAHAPLKASGRASVVAFSTVAVQTGFPFHSVVASSKGAIEGLVRSLAAEWAPGIRVNGIAPSLTDTPLAGKILSGEPQRKAAAERHPLKRVGRPDDAAEAAVFLLTGADWITGQILSVDGGLSRVRG